MSSRKIINIINEELKKTNNIRKAFYLDNDQKKKRAKFCKKIKNPFLRDSIRLTSGTKNKLKKGDLSIYNLINRDEKNSGILS